MATWLSRNRAVLIFTLCANAVVALPSCGGSELASYEGDTEAMAADADSPAEWLAVARAKLEQPSQVAYQSFSSRSGQQSGRLLYQDATHFRVKATIPLATTTPEGEATESEYVVVSAVDGKELRILLPSILGTASSVAVFPVDQFEQLAKVRPGSSLHRFRLESLNPICMAQALLRHCSNVREPERAEEDGQMQLLADLDAELLRSLGVIDLNDREKDFHLQFALAENGECVGVKIVGAADASKRLELSCTYLAASPFSPNEGFTLTIPAGHVIVDLAQQLTR